MNQITPDKTDISLVRCENERAIERYNLDRLAHKVIGQPVMRAFPVYVVFYHGRLIGYFHALQKTVIHPAFDLDAVSSGEILKIVKSLVTEMKRHAGDPLFVLCKGVQEFREEKLHLVRLKKSEDSLWLYDEEAE